MEPSDRVACSRLRATLSARACAARHGARIPSGAGRGAPRFPFCAACPVGGVVLLRLEAGGWARPPDSLPAEVLSPAQRKGRDGWARSFPAHSQPPDGRLDALREAAMMVPDDRGEGMDPG